MGDELDEVSFPGLLRHARARYGSVIRAALGTAGFDDVPRNGIYVLGAIARTGAPLSDIVTDLGVSKQAAGQLVDVLVARGYLDRTVDPADRRRLRVDLTERGRAAAVVSRAAIERLDTAVTERVGAAAVRQARVTLVAVADVDLTT